MLRRIATLLFVLAFLALAIPAKAQDAGPPIPFLSGPVVDEAGLLKPEDRAKLTRMLRQLDDSGKVQMAILVPARLGGLDIDSYSMAVAEKWKLGTKGKDQGLLFVIAPHERRMRIEVGYGLEGDITDAYTRRLREDIMAPYFRAGRYGDGLAAAVSAIALKLGVSLDETVAPPPDRAESEPKAHLPTVLLILVLFFVLVVLFSGGGGGPWIWGGGGFGGGWGGGGDGDDGGGFSGGGGGFGGGGSSGSW